ncbi:MAG: hypothetical protein CXT69_04590 [Methanobacteriota archaeon]|jgi:electron transfer flavoprotein beta subunit|nr:MAG: hypothetical protein CXT69_04590 [Euryarchaeota archaeon]
MPNIVVLVKRVPDTNAKITVSGGSLDLAAVKFVTSPFDEYAIETALRHKEANGGTVTALTLGNDACDKVLKDAKALGVDNLVRLWSEGWENLDSNGVQSALASAISDLGSEVVYCGKAAADSNAGSTGPGVAERLGWASVSNASTVSFEEAGVEAMIPSSSGQARVGLNFPCVVSLDKGEMEPRRPNVRGIMMAKRAVVEVISADAPTPTVNVIRYSPPAEKPPGKTYEGAGNVSSVVQALRNEAGVI